MSIDIMGRGVGFNWWAWQLAYEAGLASGWKPAGTEPPEDWNGAWSGNYFSNDLQKVTTDDACAWAMAVRRTCDALAGIIERTADQEKFIKDMGGTTEYGMEALAMFAEIAERGPMVLN